MRPLAPLTPEAVQKLPRDLLNCILGIAAVHLAARHPGNRQIERVALETKVGLFQGINRLFQGPKDQGADLLFCCIALMFAMDVSMTLQLLICRLTENTLLQIPNVLHGSC